ncbi:MAG: DUF2961 domain-containing protein [Planctomycetota bacterium]|nr:MAG: DUF2961 domain-containing protein [Planctomycetota bacterium]
MKVHIIALFVFTTSFAFTTSPARAGDWSGLSSIMMPQDYQSARASSADPTGGNKDSLSIPAGKTLCLANLQGPGIIKHLWFTLGSEDPAYLSNIYLKFTWDSADTPAVESPIGHFFGLGHNEVDSVISAFIVVSASKAGYIKYPPGRGAFNCYFPMPFYKNARLEVENKGTVDLVPFFFHIDYKLHKSLPEKVRYFHACYREKKHTVDGDVKGNNLTAEKNYVILDAEGGGHYVGCTLHVAAYKKDGGKWYEGDDMIMVDGKPLKESILGTGGEDYFNMAWGARVWFQSPYFGTSYHRWNPGEPEMAQYGRFSLYRWHLPDPVAFKKSIRVTI